MKLGLTLLLSSLLTACNAYRTAPESEVLFTKQDLSRGGFLLAPISADEGTGLNADDLAAADSILATTLQSSWPNTFLLTSLDLRPELDSERLESWRSELHQDRFEASSQLVKDLNLLKTPTQTLIPRVIHNSVSCGSKDALAAQQNPQPTGSRVYCQRLMKMRFRIVNLKSQATVWNGIVYATQEKAQSTKVQGDEQETALEAPGTQTLIRDCLQNFAKQFADR